MTKPCLIRPGSFESLTNAYVTNSATRLNTLFSRSLALIQKQEMSLDCIFMAFCLAQTFFTTQFVLLFETLASCGWRKQPTNVLVTVSSMLLSKFNLTPMKFRINTLP